MRTNTLFAAFAAAAAVTASRADAQFTPVPHSMTTARYFATSTLLQNGKVLIAGGNDDAGHLTSAELYDPATGTFTPTRGSMSSERADAMAVLLPNGKVLIAGGSAAASAELYDPATDAFAPTTGTMLDTRIFGTATLLSSGKVLIAGGEIDGSLSNSTAELYDPSTDTFTATAHPMTLPRQGATATLLPGGKVLIAGGYSSGIRTSTAELYDPAADTFAETTHFMTSARQEATATLLSNGKVLIAGGYDGNVDLSSAELYDPNSDSFAKSSGTMTLARVYATASLLPSGNVLIAGGKTSYPDAPVASAELYDPIHDSFGPTPISMRIARYLHTTTLLPTGEVLIAGGYGEASLSSAELFVSSQPSFATTTPSMNTTREYATSTLLPNGKVLIAGGYDFTGTFGNSFEEYDLASTDIYDYTTNTFAATTPTMIQAHDGGTATLLQNGRVLVAGGDGGESDAELYDPDANTFVETPAMNVSRSNATATLLPNGKVLIAGGDGYGYVNSVEIYDPAANTFAVTTPSMKSARAYATATLLPNGKVLISGGQVSQYPYYLSSTELYDPVANTFAATTPSMNAARAAATATLLPNGKVLIAGGYNLDELPSTDIYDPATNTFETTTPSMNFAHAFATSTLLSGGRVLIAGGGGSRSYTEIYDPISNSFASTTPAMNVFRASAMSALLPNGKVLIAGGIGGVNLNPPVLSSTEIFDEGLGFSDANRPVVDSITSPILEPGQITVTGSGFRASTQEPPGAIIGSESSGGTTANSASNYPLLQLQRVDNDQQFVIPMDESGSQDWTDSSCLTAAVANLPVGPYRATVLVNGIPSDEKVIVVEPEAIASSTGLSSACAGSSFQLTLTVNGLTVALPASISINWGDGSPLDVEKVSSVPSEFSHAVTPGDDGGGPVGTSYAIAISDSNGPLTVLGTPVSLTVGVVPTAIVGPGGFICAGETSYQLSGSGAGFCSWFPFTGLDDPESCTPLATPSETTTYTLTVYDVTGCPSTNNPTALVTVGLTPGAPFLFQEGCLSGSSTSFLSASGDQSDTFTWTMSSGSIVSGQGTSTLRFITPPAGSTAVVSVVETTPLGCASTPGMIVIASQFADIAGNEFSDYICDIQKAGITVGCGNGDYCPSQTVTRDTMAVFLLRAEHGGSYTPPACVSPVFNDVPCSNIYSAWINQLAAEGITLGCGNGDYCPLATVTRDTMAVFILRTAHGGSYTPPPCDSPIFADVPCSNIYAAWIDQLWSDEIVSGCGNGDYCPTDNVTREEMAKFLDLALLNRP